MTPVPSRRVDFLVSNPGHHIGMFRPVIRLLRREASTESRLLSLCELRGLRSPTDVAREESIDLVRLFPPLRRSPSLGRGGDSRASRLRRLGHALAWRGFLKPALRRSLGAGPALVVLPNDAAYPFDRICAELRQHGVPFLLVQEGIRFTPPSTQTGSLQGSGGADAVAVWGPSSARFFEAQGVAEDRIALTGCPRFDEIETTDWTPEVDRLRSSLDLGSRNLLFLSNPIDDLGYCDHDGKLRFFAEFAARLRPLLNDPLFRLLVKLHPRESQDDFDRVLRPLGFANRVILLREAPLYPLLEVADGAVTFGSSAGLEALLFGLPLAVLEVPGHGYLHDFVSSGAATGLPATGDIVTAVESLLSDAGPKPAVESYLRDNLATRSDAARRVAELVSKLVAPDSPAL